MSDVTVYRSGSVVVAASGLASDWIASVSKETTRRAYSGELARFAQWSGSDPGPATAALFAGGYLTARRTVLAYRDHLSKERGLSPATINRALAALRSLCRLACHVGIIGWQLDVRGLKARAHRDTAGYPPADVQRIVAAADQMGARDSALVRVAYGLALRRAEVASLRVGDVRDGRIDVLGKGDDDRRLLTAPEPVLGAVEAWLDVHPLLIGASAPLFCRLDRAGKGRPMSGAAVYEVVRRACAAAGVKSRGAHALRHSATTRALDLTGGDIRSVQRFARHAKPETTIIYDDARRDDAGRIAALLWD